MKLLVVFVSLLVAISALSEEEAWIEFKRSYLRAYKSLREDKLRFQIFKSNLQMINKHNERFQKGQESYTMKVNQFADLTDEEFSKLYLGYQRPQIEFMGRFEPTQNLTAESVDWRAKGAVLSVKNQGQCGSCWAFSAIGALEGQNAIKNSIKDDLSEQELLDCSGSYGNQACNGGVMDYAFKYMQSNGISTDKSYPYRAARSSCARASHARSSVKVSGYKDVAASESALQSAVASVGPISVAIAADKIKFYEGGVFDNFLCGRKLNHGVLAVGFDSLGTKDYWIVKNSWGSSWGENGYIKMVRNKSNQCGIALQTSYPVIA